MACGRENAAAVETEDERSLCALKFTWANHPTKGVSDYFAVGATATVTASLWYQAKVTTSSTYANQVHHPARRLTNSAHSRGPNTRTASARAERAWPLTSRRGSLFIYYSANAGPFLRKKKKVWGGGGRRENLLSMTQRSTRVADTYRIPRW